MINEVLHRVTVTAIHHKEEEVLANIVANSHLHPMARQALMVEEGLRLALHQLPDTLGNYLQLFLRTREVTVMAVESRHPCHKLQSARWARETRHLRQCQLCIQMRLL